MAAQTTKLEELLIKEGLLTEDQLSQLKFESVNTDVSLEDILKERKIVPEEKLVQVRAKALNTPFVTVADRGISVEVLGLISEPVARRYQLIPFDREKDALKVAMADPLDLTAIKFVEKKSGLRVLPYFATSSDISLAISQQYAQAITTEISAAVKEIKTVTPETIAQLSALPGMIREAPIAKIVSTLLEYGIKARASDIHIEPQEEKTRVRYRVDGILHEKIILPRKVHESVVSRIKILAGMKIDEKRIPQDGRFNFKVGEQEVDLRVSSLPSVFGEKIVMRLLKKSGGVPTLPELGLSGVSLRNAETSVARPHGIILVCGPTGSGKTTTLYSLLTKIATPKVNVITIEDPVEYQIAGVNQVQVNPAAGLTFASGLRSFLRQDPDIMMVGEIRDKETADLAVQAALTGHLVFSTVHTNTASGAIPRLLDLGAPAFLLASSMNCIIGQRVARRICKSCREEYLPSPAILKDIKDILGKLFPKDDKVKLYRGKGCPECNKAGYVGRVGIFEVLPISEKIARLTLERSPASVIEKQAIEEGMITMKQDGYLKALAGITTIEEILRVAQD